MRESSKKSQGGLYNMPQNPTLPPKSPRSGVTFHCYFDSGHDYQCCELTLNHEVIKEGTPFCGTIFFVDSLTCLNNCPNFKCFFDKMAVICPDFKWFLNPAVVARFVKASFFHSVNSAPSAKGGSNPF